MLDLLMPHPQERLSALLSHALSGLAFRTAETTDELRGRRLLFALSSDEYGMNAETLALLRFLRANPACLDGCVGSVIVDGRSELYTKQIAQELVLAANTAGCAFPGKPLVEGTGSLYNQHILAARRGQGLLETYFDRAGELAQRLEGFVPPRFERPKLLVLHASEYGRSSTLWLWSALRERLQGRFRIREIALQNGTIHDCRGCSYSACLHFAQNDACFYGGAISDTVFPAIRECDAMLFLCPNYNDAVGANITALFNRLTGLLLRSDLHEKYLFGLIVSGYSGSELVARQLLGTMCLNKTAMLPPRFCMMQTANDLAAVQRIDGIDGQLDRFAEQMLFIAK